MSWGYSQYPKYVTVAEKKARAEKKLQQLKKKTPGIRPVVIVGSTLARSWWAKTWNRSLERYADYRNRIDRGKSYVRHGAVLDLKITSGKVRALVMGSASKPYEVVVDILPMKKNNWQELQNHCQGHLKSLQDLLAGKFPQALAEVFFTEGKGLFPGPRDIKFQCSCPDWASMCKHVAATLYGIGARFDEDPSLFFTLRGLDTGDLIAGAVKDRTEELLKRTKKKSAKIIDDSDLSNIFGIDMDEKPDFAALRKETLKKRPTAKTIAHPLAPLQKQGNTAHIPKTATDLVAAIIMADTSGVTFAELVDKTGYAKTKLYGIVHRLKQLGRIKNLSSGVYVKV